MRRLIICCWAMDKALFTTQYKTKPAGKKNIIPPKTKGMIIMTRACRGSGGVGFSLICRNMVAIMMAGKIKYGSGAAKFLIQRIQGAPRISTLPNKTQYKAMNTRSEERRVGKA